MEKDVVILTAAFGNGHHTAMEAVAAALLSKRANLEVVKADIYEIATPSLKAPLSRSYNYLTRSPLPIFNSFYSLRNGKYLRVDDLVVALYFKRFEKKMADWQPRVIVSVFPTGAEFAARYKQAVDPQVKLCTVITDVVAAWEWIHPQTDWYAVPTEQIKQALVEKGIEEAQIFVTGVPVRATGGKRDEANCSTTRVLMIGSAMGKLIVTDKVLRYMASTTAQYQIVTGNDEQLYQHLMTTQLPPNVTVTGFAKDLEARMATADLIVTKPGGATLFEALANEVPLLVYKSNIKQEHFNARFVQSSGLGSCYRTADELIEKLDWLLGDEVARKAMIANIQEIKRSIDLEALIAVIIDHLEATPKAVSAKAVVANRQSIRGKRTLQVLKDKGRKEKDIDEVGGISKIIKARRIANRK